MLLMRRMPGVSATLRRRAAATATRSVLSAASSASLSSQMCAYAQRGFWVSQGSPDAESVRHLGEPLGVVPVDEQVEVVLAGARTGELSC